MADNPEFKITMHVDLVPRQEEWYRDNGTSWPAPTMPHAYVKYMAENPDLEIGQHPDVPEAKKPITVDQWLEDLGPEGRVLTLGPGLCCTGDPKIEINPAFRAQLVRETAQRCADIARECADRAPGGIFPVGPGAYAYDKIRKEFGLGDE